LCTHAVAFKFFVLSGLIQIQNRIQNHLKCFEIFEKEKEKRNLLLFLAFGPAAQLFLHDPHCFSRTRPVLPLPVARSSSASAWAVSARAYRFVA
jgi:hypothetical protein